MHVVAFSLFPSKKEKKFYFHFFSFYCQHAYMRAKILVYHPYRARISCYFHLLLLRIQKIHELLHSIF